MVDVRWFPSPNHTVGRRGNRVEYIVIHYIVGRLSAADQVFTNPSSQVSAHYGIGEGEVHQYVSEINTAWHAGKFDMNTRSVGIEHSADPNRAPDQWTYDKSIELCTELCQKYGLNPRTAIIPHKQVVATLCPGTVDIERIIRGVEERLAGSRRTYRPLIDTSREAMAAFLYRLSGSPDFAMPSSSPFRDIPPNHVFYREICWMWRTGISRGWDDGTYRPLENTSREVMAAFLYRLKGSPDFAMPSSSPFRDVLPDNVFYREICWMWRTGISRGWDDGTYRPFVNTSREAMAAFLYRFKDSPDFTMPSSPPFRDVPTNHVFYREISWMWVSGVSRGWEE